jgi:hypothetical protein
MTTSTTENSVNAKALPLLRQSERQAFARCPQAWYWSYVEGLTPIAEKKAAADFGTITHVALAEYYKPGTERGPHPAQTWYDLGKEHVQVIKTVEYTNDEEVAKWEDFLYLGPDLMDAYVDLYQGDPHWDILDAERRFSVTIPDVRIAPRTDNGRRGFTPICTLVGTLDLVFRDLNDGFVKMLDHKTCNRIYTDKLELDPQASTYIAVGTHALREQGLIGPKEVIRGMEYNFIRKGKIDTRPQNEKGEYLNKDGSVSKQQGSPLFRRHFVPRTHKERQRTIVRISQEAAVMNMVAKGEIPVLKNTNAECAFCKFFDLCQLDEAGEDTTYYKQTVYKQHDPYFDHRPDAINSKKVT